MDRWAHISAHVQLSIAGHRCMAASSVHEAPLPLGSCKIFTPLPHVFRIYLIMELQHTQNLTQDEISYALKKAF